MKKSQILLIFFVIAMAACHPGAPAEKEESIPDVVTPVTVTSVTAGDMTDYIELNATSGFLLKAFVKASSNGYIQLVNAQPGRIVSAGQMLFTIKTKESQSIGNTINLLDTSFKFSGVIGVRAGTTGYISEVDHQSGDYVQEGEQLAVINNLNSFVFILNLPYELRPFVLNKKTVELLLPDGKSLTGTIVSTMPVVDSVSQTQNVVIHVNEKSLPANLIAKVRVIKTTRAHTISLPPQAILSDETQSNFWVMKVIDSATAVKVPVTKGIETKDRSEILSPAFSPNDKFLLTGNYGLGDTAKIKIIQP